MLNQCCCCLLNGDNAPNLLHRFCRNAVKLITTAGRLPQACRRAGPNPTQSTEKQSQSEKLSQAQAMRGQYGKNQSQAHAMLTDEKLPKNAHDGDRGRARSRSRSKRRSRSKSSSRSRSISRSTSTSRSKSKT